MSQYLYPACVRIDAKFFFISDQGHKAVVGEKFMQDPPTRDELRDMAKSILGQLNGLGKGKFRMMHDEEVDEHIDYLKATNKGE